MSDSCSARCVESVVSVVAEVVAVVAVVGEGLKPVVVEVVVEAAEREEDCAAGVVGDAAIDMLVVASCRRCRNVELAAAAAASSVPACSLL